jgi:hypothetical protein
MVLVVWLLVLLTSAINTAPTFLMFFLPWLLVSINDFRRIAAAKNSTTPVALALGDKYDARYQTRLEYAFLLGDMIGLWVPIFLLRGITIF